MLRLLSISEASNALRDGRLVVLPTETVYGLGANASSAEAVTDVYAAKGRPIDHPLILHVRDRAHAEELADVGPLAAELMQRFWPGPLTLILPTSARTPRYALGGTETVALRCAAHEVFAEVLDNVPFAVAAPSANPFGQVSPTRAEDVRDFSPSIAGVLDGGPARFGVESTILDVRNGISCVRPGGLPLEHIERHLGIAIEQKVSVRAPGTHSSHYAPQRARIWAADSWAAALQMQARIAFEAGYTSSFVLGVGTRDPSAQSTVYRDDDAFAQDLFAAFRRLDDRGVSDVICVLPPATGVGAAVRDRILRASFR